MIETLDKYYTKNTTVSICLEELELNEYDFIIEPSAGAGAFYNCLPNPKIGLDIEPDYSDLIKENWLKYKIPSYYRNVLIVGNPPYGRNHYLSTKFIKHSLSFSNVKTIAFILADVYQKYTRQRIIPKIEWRIKNIIKLPKNSFIFEGNEKHIPCSFFIFDKSDGKDLRCDPNKYKDKVDFTFGTKNDFDLFLFGAAPKKIITNPALNNRGHYLKSKIPVNQLLEKLNKIKWTGYSCANGGVYWLTQTEIIEQYYKTYKTIRNIYE